MDADLRELERRFAAGDTTVTETLERAWIRSGRGWFGEEIREGEPRPDPDERRVYYFHKKKLVDYRRGIQLVRVPGGLTECGHFLLPGHGYRLRNGRAFIVPAESGGVAIDKKDCPVCDGSGARRVEPFFCGRFPVLNDEFDVFIDRAIDFKMTVLWPEHRQRPVTEVTPDRAREFCVWAGMRLMTIAEWEWACWGGIENRIDGRRPTYPWGDAPPDKTRCVQPAERTDMVTDATGKPAREAGKSWCLVHDLTGNVSQFVDADNHLRFAIMGGSFKSPRPMDPHHSIAFGGRRPMDHVGFRVALSIKAPS